MVEETVEFITFSSVSEYAYMISWRGCSHESELGFLRAVGSSTAEGEAMRTDTRAHSYNHVAYLYHCLCIFVRLVKSVS